MDYLGDIASRGLGCNFFSRHTRRQLNQLERAGVIGPRENGDIGDDHIDDILAS